jgi:hypothetical protein
MKKQILSEEFKRMQKLAGILNENESIKPKEITVKINPSKNTKDRTWRKDEIILNTRESVNVGNDVQSGATGMKMLYFAKYVPEQDQIKLYVGADKNSLKDLTQRTFDSFEVGSKDDDDMFEITSIK